MNNQQAVVDQIVQNLAFDVEAVPKNELIQTTSMSQSAPLNMKIKVRKKDERHMRNDVPSIADNTSRTVQKVRLVNSDRTIMTFDVFMEAEFEKKPTKKLRKHIFDMLRPGICLGAVDDDESPYMPGTSYSANITKPSVATKSDGTLKQTFTLSKNVYQEYSVSTQPAEQKWLFGTCKAGGCLDPPFGEDKYSYKPSTRSGPEREEEDEEPLEAEDVESVAYKHKKPITLHDEENQSNGRQSSIFDSGLFKKKRKSSDKSTNTKIPDKTDSIVDIYQGESGTNFASTHSNPLITYPPKTKSGPRISDDKTVRSRGPSEDRPRKSFNDHSEPYFTRPKGVQRIKENDTLHPNDQPKPRSSDTADLRNLPKEYFKMPVPIPIPIPVPIPTISSKRKPEDIAINYDIIEKDSIPGQKLQDQEPRSHELQDQGQQNQELQGGTINLKDTEIPPQLLRTKSESGETDDKPDESPIATLIPSNVKKPNSPNEIDDQNLNETKLQLPLHAKETDNNIEDTAQPESLKIPVAVPVPFAINTHFEGSKDVQQTIEPGLEKIKSFAKTTPKNNIEADVIPENFLTRGGFSDQENYTEIPVTLEAIMDTDIKRDSEGEKNTTEKDKLARTTDVKEMVAPATNYTKDDMERDSKGEEVTDGIGKLLEQKYTQEDKKRDSHEEKNTVGIETPAKPSEITDKTTISTKHRGEDIKRDSKGEEITHIIEKPTEQKDTQEDIKPDSEAKAITDGIVKLTKQEAILNKDIENEDAVTTKYDKDTSDIYGMSDMDTHQIKDTPKEADLKESQIISPSKPDMDTQQIEHTPKEDHKKDSQIISPSELKRSDNPEEYCDNIGHGDTDLGIRKDKKLSSLLSEPEYETDTGDKIKKPYSNKEYVYETNKSNIIGAPVTIDNTERNSIFGSIIEVYRETDLVREPMGPVVDPLITQISSGFKKFDDNENLQSVIYKAEKYDPSTSTKKEAEIIPSSDKRVILPGDTVLSSVQSTTTLKSAMKKDTISIDFGFHSYLNDKNERIVQTFDSTNTLKRMPGDSVTVIKSQIRISAEIRIPVDSQHDMSIQIKKANTNQRVSLSESGPVNVIDNGRAKNQRSPVHCSDIETRSSEVKAEGRKDNIHETDTTADRFLDYYEQELVPLQLIIKNLRDEIDILATQQTMFKDKLYCPNKSKLPRLVHSNKKCFGCIRK